MCTRLSNRLPFLLAVLSLGALCVTGCDTAALHQSERSLSFPEPMLNAELGPRRVARTSWDPFGWAGVAAKSPESSTAVARRDAPAPAARTTASASTTKSSTREVAKVGPERVESAPPVAVAESAAPARVEVESPRIAPAPAQASLENAEPERAAATPVATTLATSDRGPTPLADAPQATAYDPAVAAAYVTAVYDVNGVDLRKATRGGDRVPTIVEIYRHAYKSGIVYQAEQPATGDIVFFHNTFDRNGDGRWNDWYTLVGVVEGVDASGTVSALAYVDGKVTRIMLDPQRPDVAAANSALRAGDDVPAPRAGYAGALFAGYANLLGDIPHVTVIDNWHPEMRVAQK